MRAGLFGSAVLHALVALLIVFGLPRLVETPAEVEQVVPIDLVRLGDKTASPPAPEQAAMPQQEATEVSPQRPPDPVPVPQSPPPSRTAPSMPAERPKPEVLATAKPQRKPSPPLDDLDARLHALARLRQPTLPVPPNPRQQDGPGFSSLTASSANAVPGAQATYSTKDFIRAQIERHWIMDRSALGPGNWVVSIHITVSRDGRVTGAEVVDDPRFGSDAAFHALALSARNAALLSSPLTLPPDRYNAIKDMTLDFDARHASQ